MDLGFHSLTHLAHLCDNPWPCDTLESVCRSDYLSPSRRRIPCTAPLGVASPMSLVEYEYVGGSSASFIDLWNVRRRRHEFRSRDQTHLGMTYDCVTCQSRHKIRF